MRPNQMYVRFTQLGGRAVLWFLLVAAAAATLRVLEEVGPLVPGAVFLAIAFLAYFWASGSLKRTDPDLWERLGSPGLVPTPLSGTLSSAMWSWSGPVVGKLGSVIACGTFNFASIGLVLWLVSRVRSLIE